jgi:hypothetical protein
MLHMGCADLMERDSDRVDEQGDEGALWRQRELWTPF